MGSIFATRALRRRALLGSALAAPAIFRPAAADEPVQLISHRYPALEYYAGRMKSAVPGVPVNTRLVPSGDAIQLQRLAFSSKDSGMDLLWCNSVLIASYAKAGWLEPLDDLFAKYRDEFRLDDIGAASIRGVSYDGHIYGMPMTTNTLLLAYRADLLAEQNLAPPATWDDYVAAARKLNTPRRNGVTLSLKWDQPPYELNGILNVLGDGWFGKNWRPTFNSDRGVAAIEKMRQIAQYAVPGYTAQGNDENSVNFGQGICAMGQQWATRCASMDNPQKSKVVGKIEWAVPPGGRQGMVTDGYAISRFSAKNRDMLFRILATALNEESQRGGAEFATPPRTSLLNDPQMQSKYRWYPAISACLAAGEPLPALPEFLEAAEIAAKRMVQGIVGELPVKQALDTGAAEVVDLLRRRGYQM